MERELLVSDRHGQYIPQIFAQQYGHSELWNIEKDDMVVLLEGPDNPDYWEAWDQVLMRTTYTDKNGVKWWLWQDGDLFAESGEEDENDQD